RALCLLSASISHVTPLFRYLSPPSLLFLLFMPRRPPIPPLFPYTTLFRSFAMDAKIQSKGYGSRALAILKERYPKGLILEAEKRSEEHTSELQSRFDLVCRLLLEKKKKRRKITRSKQ